MRDMTELHRDFLEEMIKPLVCCEMLGYEGNDETRPDLEPARQAAFALWREGIEWLRQHPRPPAKDTKDYWAAFCDKCGWAGPSKQCGGGGPLADTGDFCAVTCPVCMEEVDDEQREQSYGR